MGEEKRRAEYMRKEKEWEKAEPILYDMQKRRRQCSKVMMLDGKCRFSQNCVKIMETYCWGTGEVVEAQII